MATNQESTDAREQLLHSTSQPILPSVEEQINESQADEISDEAKTEEMEKISEGEESDCIEIQYHNGHSFSLTTFWSRTYCNFCSEFIWGIRKQGFECNCCGYVAHEGCYKSVNSECRKISFLPDEENPNSVQFSHHWIPGNTHSSPCCFCKTKTKSKEGGFKTTSRCSTCNFAAHTQCIEEHQHSHPERFCKPQFGNLFFCDELLQSPSPPSDYKPLLIFVNTKSGGQTGHSVFNAFTKLLTQANVISLLDESPVGPMNGLNKYGKAKNLSILVCGGDGTAGWLLQDMMDQRDDFRDMERIPPTAVLPLGTGNDLARVLNWGGGYSGHKDELTKVLTSVSKYVEITQLDRWSVEVHASGESALSKEPNHLTLNNYFSIGLDAQIAMQFHHMRETNPGLFKSRAVNKGIYGLYGFQKLIDAPPCITDIGVQIETDDGTVLSDDELKKFQCLVWQNIPSYGGGSVLWSESKKQEKTALMDDGILELIGIKSIAHVVGIQSSAVAGTKLAQGKSFSINIANDCFIQVDGEPMEIGASKIEISYKNRATMLSRISSKDRK